MSNIFNYLTERFGGREAVGNSTGGSRGLKLDFTNAFKGRGSTMVGERPKFKIRNAKELLLEDGIVTAAVKKTVNKALIGGYQLRGRNGKSGEQKLKNLIGPGKWNYEEHLQEVISHLVIYQNCFVEVLDDDTINVLEIRFTEPVTDEHGNVIGYKQQVKRSDSTSFVFSPNKSKGDVQWPRDEVVHYKQNHYDTNSWSHLDLRSVYKWILIKRAVAEWALWAIDNNMLRPVLGVGNETTKTQIKDLKTMLKKMESNPRKPLVMKGDFQVDVFYDFAEQADSVYDLVNMCNAEILSALQVPPGMFGLSGEKTSGRTDPAEQRNQFNDYVRGIQRTLKVYEENELFPKLGARNVELIFGAIDNAEKRKIFENVRTMRQAQFSNEAIQQYLRENGVFFRGVDNVLKTDEEIAAMSNKDLGTGNEGIKGNVSSDEAESRERQVEDDASRGSKALKEEEE